MITHRFVCVGLVVGLLAGSWVAAPAAAQPPAVPQVDEPPEGVAGDNRLTWISNAGLNLTMETGVTDQASLQVSGSIEGHEGQRRGLAFDASHARATVNVAGTETVVADSQIAHATGRWRIGGLGADSPTAISRGWYLVARGTFIRNQIQSIDHIFEELAGVGYSIGRYTGDVPSWRLDVIPVAGAVQQEKNIAAIDGTAFSVGVLQSFIKQRLGRWTVSQTYAYLQNTEEGDDYRMYVDLSFRGTVVGPLGVQVTYSVQHSNIVLTGAENTDHRTAVGLVLTFPPRPPGQ